eukprot:5336393-Pleurochrysis_carterae.AAC.1
MPSRMSAGADSPSVRPQCPPATLPPYTAARCSSRLGGWPPSSLTASGRSTSAARMPSASRAASCFTAGNLASPTTSSILCRTMACRPCLARGTTAGTVPSPGSTPQYFMIEKMAAQAASP